MLTVINYHYIRPNFETKYPSIFGMTPDAFKNQLLLLMETGNFISGEDLIKNSDAIFSEEQHFYLITFDDGLKEQYQYALPILDELAIPALFFANSINHEAKKVSTVHKIHLLRSIISTEELLDKISVLYPIHFLEEDKKTAQQLYIYDTEESATLKYILNFKMDHSLQEQIISTVFDQYFDENQVVVDVYMNKEEIITLAKRGYLGSHTHTHYPLGLLNNATIKYELEHSKSYFENLTGANIETVAYPYGTPNACTDEVAVLAKEIGYTFGFTTTRGINLATDNYLLLNRFDCNDMPGGKNYIEI